MPSAQRRKVWLTPTTGVPCSNAANIGDRKTWTQSKFFTWQNSIRGKSPRKCMYVYTSPGDGQTSCKVWLASVERRRCSSKGKRSNPLKFAGVPQTNEPISAASGPKSTILWGIWERYCCLQVFFPIVDTCLSCEDTARQTCAMVPRRRFFDDVCVLYFQRATCSTFQTCILNSH